MKIVAKSFVLACILAFTHSAVALAQITEEANPPEIGKPVPGFLLENIRNYPKSRMSSDDFKGSFVILDFWNKGCVACVQSFPKLNQLHHKFKDQLTLILAGTEEEGIESMYERYRTKLNLVFPAVFNFPLYNRFVPGGAPHLVWIDNKGIVKAVTSGEYLNDGNIHLFLNGKSFEFLDRSHKVLLKSDSVEYDPSKPYLIDGNGGDESNFLYRSLFSKYKSGMPRRPFPPVFVKGVFDTVGDKTIVEGVTDLFHMYKLAFIGNYEWRYGDSIYTKMHNDILLEINDTSLFFSDFNTAEGFYWYSLIVPSAKATPAYLMEGMQRDLHYYFGYKAAIQTRVFPYLKLIATEKAKQQFKKSKSGEQNVALDYSMFKGSNIPAEWFFNYLFGLHNYVGMPVVINETGITGNIDIDVKVAVSEWKDVKRLLNELGFNLIPGQREFSVIVISENK